MSDAQTARALSWILIQALDISEANLPGFKIQDAHREVQDLKLAVEHIAKLDSSNPEVNELLSRVGHLETVVKMMREDYDAALKASPLNAAFEEGFELRTVGSVHQFVKKMPDVDGHWIISVGGGVEKGVRADVKDWGVVANVYYDGRECFHTVSELQTLEDALASYKLLPIPERGVRHVFQSWEEAGVNLETNGPRL